MNAQHVKYSISMSFSSKFFQIVRGALSNLIIAKTATFLQGNNNLKKEYILKNMCFACKEGWLESSVLLLLVEQDAMEQLKNYSVYLGKS